jgi:HSP20 family protein
VKASLSEEKKKKYYYYGKKEKKASDVKKEAEKGLVPYTFRDMQRDFDSMMENFQREFEDFWRVPTRWQPRFRWRHGFPAMPWKGVTMPSMDLEDHGKNFRVTVDLPGFSKEDVEIEVTDDAVVVNAEKTEEAEEKKKYVRQERTAQTFYRRIRLPEEVEADDAKASLTNGTLEITLPKKEPKKTKKVKIE